MSCILSKLESVSLYVIWLYQALKKNERKQETITAERIGPLDTEHMTIKKFRDLFMVMPRSREDNRSSWLTPRGMKLPN